jgi:hypothetical protein
MSSFLLFTKYYKVGKIEVEIGEEVRNAEEIRNVQKILVGKI